jgi:myo-inositol 2-dehydrogenase/D-chiro-inositol 1-dehydrogenase
MEKEKDPMEKEKDPKKTGREGIDRRSFISLSSMAALGTIGAAGLVSSCSGEAKKKEIELPAFLTQAPDGKLIKAGLIGCGGRGTGAAVNFLDAGPNLQITALGDVFKDKLDQCRDQLRKSNHAVEIPDENCFIGFDAYQKVIDSGVDVVLLCTPPAFRPYHIEAAVDAGKHIFMEKPVAVDPVGARKVMISVKRAQDKGLCMVSGTIRRVQKDFVETWRRVANGAIGEIVSAHITRNGGGLVGGSASAWLDRYGVYASQLGKFLLAFGRPYSGTIYP